MKHCYVFMFDDEANEWVHATSVEEEKFDSYTAYNPISENWEHPYKGDGTYIPNEEKTCAKVSLMIEQLNEKAKYEL